MRKHSGGVKIKSDKKITFVALEQFFPNASEIAYLGRFFLRSTLYFVCTVLAILHEVSV